jgi:hypothetical protein
MYCKPAAYAASLSKNTGVVAPGVVANPMTSPIEVGNCFNAILLPTLRLSVTAKLPSTVNVPFASKYSPVIPSGVIVEPVCSTVPYRYQSYNYGQDNRSK